MIKGDTILEKRNTMSIKFSQQIISGRFLLTITNKQKNSFNNEFKL